MTGSEFLVENLLSDLGQLTDKDIQEQMIIHFYRADQTFDMRLAKEPGFKMEDFKG